MYRLDAFKLADMISCSADIRRIGIESVCVEEAAEKIVRHLYEHLVDRDGQPALVLVRFYKTVRFDDLSNELKLSASASYNGESGQFLTLMATAGLLDRWNDRNKSGAHRLIPVNDEQAMQKTVPIMAHLRSQLEMGASWIPDDQSLLRYVMEPEQKRFNVFYVPDAANCPFATQGIVVENFGVRSMLAYGAMLNRSSFFGVVMFSRVAIPKDCAEMFNPLALSTKNAIIYSTDFGPLVARPLPA